MANSKTFGIFHFLIEAFLRSLKLVQIPPNSATLKTMHKTVQSETYLTADIIHRCGIRRCVGEFVSSTTRRALCYAYDMLYIKLMICLYNA